MNITRKALVTVDENGVLLSDNTGRTEADFINETGVDVWLYNATTENLATVQAGAGIPLRAGSQYLDKSKSNIYGVCAASLTAAITIIERQA